MSTSRGLGRELEGARRDERIWRKKRAIPPWRGEGGPLIFSTVRLRPIREIPDLVEKERCNVDARFPGEFSRDTALRPNFEGMELTSIAYIEQKWKRYEEMDTQLSSTFTTGCRCLPKALPKAASLDGLEDDRRMFSCLFRLVGGPAGPPLQACSRSMVEVVDQLDRLDGDHHLAEHGQCQVILMILVLVRWTTWWAMAFVGQRTIVIAARLRNGWRKTLTCSEPFISPHKIALIVPRSGKAGIATHAEGLWESPLLHWIVFFQLALTVVPLCGRLPWDPMAGLGNLWKSAGDIERIWWLRPTVQTCWTSLWLRLGWTVNVLSPIWHAEARESKEDPRQTPTSL